MHAVVIHVTIHDRAEAKRALDDEIIPMMKSAPGFVGAYFVALDDSHGVSVQVFDTEEHARAVAPSGGGAAPGVTMDSLQFGDVIGAA